MHMSLPRGTPRTILVALWAAFLIQTAAAAWQADGPMAAVVSSAGLAGGALLLWGLAASTVVSRRGVTLLGAWSLWVLLVGSTAQLAGVAWSISLRARLADIAGAEMFHFIGTVLALLGLLLVGIRSADAWSGKRGRYA